MKVKILGGIVAIALIGFIVLVIVQKARGK